MRGDALEFPGWPTLLDRLFGNFQTESEAGELGHRLQGRGLLRSAAIQLVPS